MKIDSDIPGEINYAFLDGVLVQRCTEASTEGFVIYLDINTHTLVRKEGEVCIVTCKVGKSDFIGEVGSALTDLYLRDLL